MRKLYYSLLSFVGYIVFLISNYLIYSEWQWADTLMLTLIMTVVLAYYNWSRDFPKNRKK